MPLCSLLDLESKVSKPSKSNDALSTSCSSHSSEESKKDSHLQEGFKLVSPHKPKKPYTKDTLKAKEETKTTASLFSGIKARTHTTQ
jgi:hypothetical protein